MMNSITIDYRTTDGKSPTDVRLLHNPLDFIAEDHLRLRMMCAEMDELTDAFASDPRVASEMSRYLKDELPRLLCDEDNDLMPRLLMRADAEDDVPKLINRLKREHAEIKVQLVVVMDGLEKFPKHDGAFAKLKKDLHQLARMTRRHLILENAVLLPLARARLTEDDLREMRTNMQTRRGLTLTTHQ